MRALQTGFIYICLMSRPKVSVSLITFNHEKYLVACLDSIVKQLVNFDLEIVVSDDCSTDKTPEIVAFYASKYPELIKPIYRKQNLGMVKNALDTIKQCRGDYIAILEGDDFWPDEHKLQAQADYLDLNTDCVICYTNGYIFYEDEPLRKDFFFTSAQKPPEKLDLDFYIWYHPIIPNNTKMFRKTAHPEIFPLWIYDAINWDWILHVLQLINGKAGYIDAITLAYRRHPGAAFNAQSEEKILFSGIATAVAMNKYLNFRYNDSLKNLWWENRELALIYLQKRSIFKFLAYYSWFIFSVPRTEKMKAKDELWRIKTALLGRKS